MVEEGILDGDFALIRKADTARDGEIVVALIDDEEATLKTFRREGQMIRLDPANRHYEPQRYRPRPGADPGPAGRADPALLSDGAMARIDYVELPSATAHELTRGFYAKAFGWTFTDYGPDLFRDHQRRHRCRPQRPAGRGAVRAAAGDPGRRSRSRVRRGDQGRRHRSPSRSSPFPAAAASTSSTRRQRTRGVASASGAIPRWSGRSSLAPRDAVGREAAARHAGGSAPRSARDRCSRSCRR